jgi:hypothetical protein
MQYVNKHSRHCRLCEKCVAHFDHHCKWLNNCIGEHNYRYFFALIVSTFFLTCLHLSFNIYLFVQCFTAENTSNILTRSAVIYGCKEPNTPCAEKDTFSNLRFSLLAIQILAGIYIGLLVPSTLSITQLVVFHIKLCNDWMMSLSRYRCLFNVWLDMMFLCICIFSHCATFCPSFTYKLY